MTRRVGELAAQDGDFLLEIGNLTGGVFRPRPGRMPRLMSSSWAATVLTSSKGSWTLPDPTWVGGD